MMERWNRFAIEWYSRMLRLYPPLFRAEFADEMQDVFTAAVQDCSDGWSLIGLAAGEVRDLPFRLLQEHLATRRKQTLATDTGVIIMDSGTAGQVFRFFGWSLLIVLVVFALMAVLPFFALGLQTHSQMEVISGSLGPEAFPPYSGYQNPLPGIAVFILLGAPVWNVVFGVIVLLMLAFLWRRLPSRQRYFGLVSVVAAVVPLLFLFLPVGKNLFSWWMN